MPEYTGIELKSALQSQVDIINEGMAKGVKVDGANVEMSSDTAKEIKSAFAKAQEIKGLMDAQRLGSEVKHYMEDPSEDPIAMRGGGQRVEAKSLGELFAESGEFKDFASSGRKDMQEAFEVKMADVAGGSVMEVKDVFGASATANYTRNFGNIQFDPMIPRAHRMTRVRDLFPVASTNASVIDYFRVLGYTNNAASVADRRAANGTSAPVGDSTDVFGKKPHTRLAFESKQASVRTVAHWEAAHRNVIADVPQLRSTIDNELLYGLRLEEDRQILKGSGTGEELLGILNTPGIQNYTAGSGEIPSDSLRKSATLAMLANYQSTGYILHPFDWENVELQKGNDGQYMLVTNIAVGAGATAWRQPVVETPAMDEGTFLTGAFGLGVQLYDREQANVRISEHHEDFFVRNAIVILVEERLALAVKRPESLIKGTFAA